MPYLPDEQWVMIKDSIDKKNIARSSHNKRSHCGKGGSVKFPSDYMTKKELKAMNGEVKMSIAEAVSIANEFQVSLEYLLGRYPYPLPAPQTEEEWMVYEKLGQMDENEAQKYLEMMMPMKKDLP